MARRECFAGFGAPLTSKSGRILLAVVLAGGSAFAGPIHPVAAVAVGSQSQTITFTPPYDGVVGTSLDLQASATSGLVVTFALAPTSACSLNGGTLSFVSAGSCDVTASQPGNSTWAAAPSVTQAIDAAPAYEVSWLVTPPDSSTRAAGTIEVGDRLAIEIAAADDTAVTACSIRITSAGGWVMDTSGDLTGGKCSLWFTLPDYTYPGDRANFGRVDDDLCVSILSLTFADSQPRAMDPADREAPGGVACYNGSDRSDREDRVLDFQVVDGGTPQPFASSPAMLSWNPNDWVGYTPLQFGQTTHLELPDIGAV